MDDPEGHQGSPGRWCHSLRYVICSFHWFSFLSEASILTPSLSFGSTDFEKTFIQCIVFNYNVLREYGDEGSVKSAGKVLTKGKDYVVEDGDIILIKAGAAKG